MTALPADQTPQPRRNGNLVAAIATVGCVDIAMGLTLQLLPLLMEREHIHAWIIGLNAAVGPIGILLAGPWLPRVVSRFGSKRLVIAAVLTMIATLAAFKLAPSIWWWFPIRFLFGISASIMFTVSEAWILTFAGDGSRGRVMGIFTSVLALTFSVGPLIVPLTGIEGWAPWLISIGFVALGMLPLLFVKVSDDHFREQENGGFRRFFAKAPMLLVAVAAATLFDNVFISFFTIFGLRHGVPLAEASRILGYGIIGNVLMFYPMGWLADHWSRSGVMVLTSIATVVLALSLSFAINSWIIFPVAILLSASAFGVYVVSLALMGDSFKGPDLVAGSAAFAAMWGVGGLIGPPLAGALIDSLGINTLPVTLASFHAILLVGLALTGGKLVRDSGPALVRAVIARSANIPRQFSYGAGVALAAAGAVFWSLGGALVRATSGIDAWQIIFYRSITVLVCMAVWLTLRFGRDLPARIASAGTNGVIAGILVGTAGLTYLMALFYTTVAQAIFMTGITPFLSALLGWWILRERVSALTWTTMTLALAGMGLIFSASPGGGAIIGTVLAIYSAFCFSGYAVLLRWGQKTEMSVALIWNALFLIAVSAAVVLLPTGLRASHGLADLEIGWWNLAVIVVMGVVQLSVGLILFTLGSRSVPAAQLSLIALIEPTLSPLWAWLVAREVPAIWTFAGGGVILSAIVILALSSATRERRYA